MNKEIPEGKDIGTVISTPTSPNPDFLAFVAIQGTVHRGQFAELEYSEGTLIALITNVVKTNRYFERAESVKEFELKGSALFEQFPTSEWEYLVAETKPLGVFRDGIVRKTTYPPSPGTKVKIASADKLKKFYNFDFEKGLYLGELEYHNVSVKLNLTKALQKHVFLGAQSGFGKSFLCSVMIEELLDRKKEHGRIAIVAFDPHGEYGNFAQPVKDKKYTDYSDKTHLVKGQNIKIGVPKLSIGMIANIIPGLSSAQKRDLGKILNKLNTEMKDGQGPFDLGKVRKTILEDEKIKGNTKGALLAWIEQLEETHLFAKTDNPSLVDLVKPGKLTVIDLSDMIDMRKKQIIVSYFANKLFQERRMKRLAPFLLIVEEAHQFIPQYSAEETSVSRDIMRTIAREGRKFGCSLCLISQRPVQLDTTTLSQCNTQVILRITNPNDLKHISESAEAIDQKSLDMITSLQVGEALMIGEAVRYPLFFKVRMRKSQPSIHERTLEESAIDFETSQEIVREENEAYL